jgi:type VI protein secretion system component VasK
MGQVTIYLDDENEKRLKAAAKSAGMPVSRWVAHLVEEKTRTVWPESVRQLAGAWQDFPDLETIRASEGEDSGRESL